MRSIFAEESETLRASEERARWQHELVDELLTRPSPWSGSMRRQVLGYAGSSEVTQYQHAYGQLVVKAADDGWRLSLSELLHVNRAVGGPGRLRRILVHVGRFRRFPRPAELPEGVDEIIHRHSTERGTPVAAAIRLHLRLVTCHPFDDGNGRSARLVGSMSLANAGLRSTLLVALEEIFARRADCYARIVDRYWLGECSEQSCVTELMALVIERSAGIALVRGRRRRVAELAQHFIGEQGSTRERLEAFEVGAPLDRGGRELKAWLESQGIVPWYQVVRALSERDRSSLLEQIYRVGEEEALKM